MLCAALLLRYNFNPRAPYGARPLRSTQSWTFTTNFNPRAPYGARPAKQLLQAVKLIISIHAPHTGRDRTAQRLRVLRGGISIHAPHTGRDALAAGDSAKVFAFQSTRPIRGATLTPRCTRVRFYSISIHAPHTGRDILILLCLCTWHHFNPRAPYGARRCCSRYSRDCQFDFNPRAPYGARLICVHAFDNEILISIHAPHTGRDLHTNSMLDIQMFAFQSTRPIRGATTSLTLSK